MKKWPVFIIDVAVISASPFAAILLRDNFLLIPHKLVNAIPYALTCTILGWLFTQLFGVHKGLWRYTSIHDLSAIILAVLTTVSMTTTIAVAFGYYKGIALSVPVIQSVIAIGFMSALRLVVRSLHQRQRGPGLRCLKKEERCYVLVIGLSDAAELYIRWSRRLKAGVETVAGILDENEHVCGRSLLSCRVIGSPQELKKHLGKFQLHGLSISRVVLAVPLDSLSIKSQNVLKACEAEFGVAVEVFDRGGADATPERVRPESAYLPSSRGVHESSYVARGYPSVKRLVDLGLGIVALVLLWPLFLAVGLLVLVELGYPVVFWQQRVGQHGRPFSLFKFRTMSDGLDMNGNQAPDSSRLRGVGRFLRQSRLDELPQLINILRGHMSFVGPRPLLRKDQPQKTKERLSVKPGLTGWAQINGAEHISAEEKAVLDSWYVQRMSFLLDMWILAVTAGVVFFGSKRNRTSARQTSGRKGVQVAKSSYRKLPVRGGAKQGLPAIRGKKVA